MRRFGPAIGCFLAATFQVRAQVPQRPLTVTSCTQADSLLGRFEDDRRGTVRGFYSTESDETFLTAGSIAQTMGSPHYFGGTIRYLGTDPLTAGDSIAWGAALTDITLYLRGRPGLALQEVGALPQSASLVADESAVPVRALKLGEYRGPPQMAIVPVTFLVTYRSLLQAVRAGHVEVRLGGTRYEMSSNDRRSLRAMLRIALCSGARSQ